MSEGFALFSLKTLTSGGGGSASGKFVGSVTNNSSAATTGVYYNAFPTARLDGSALQDEDFVRVHSSATTPMTIAGKVFSTSKSVGYYYDGDWVIMEGILPESNEVMLKNKASESISGTSTNQSQANAEFKTEVNKKLDKATTTVSIEHAYIHKADGTDGLMQINGNANAYNAIVRRQPDGQLKVPATPASNDDATSKKYVDDHSGSKKNAYESIKQHADYLFEMQFTQENIDQEYAYNVFTSTTGDDLPSGACTGVYYNKKTLRQYDWYYDNLVDFLVRVAPEKVTGKYGSVALCGALPYFTKDAVGKETYNEKYKLVPFTVIDGINEHGLFFQQNVVPKKANDISITHTSTESKGSITTNMIGRILLDNCKTVSEVAAELAKYDIKRPTKMPAEYDSHYLICDSTGAHKILEFTADGHGYQLVSFATDYEVITNFNVLATNGISTDGQLTLNWNAISADSAHNEGLERFELCAEEVKKTTPDIASLRSKLNYTHAYSSSTSPFWYTEYCGMENEEGEILTPAMAKTDPGKFTQTVLHWQDRYNNRTREDTTEQTWQSVHSAIYDLTDKSINLVIQERDSEVFNVFYAGDNKYDAEIAKKLDKVSSASKVYVTDASGNQSTLGYDTDSSASSIVQRNASGQVKTEAPTAEKDAANKKYVDDENAKQINLLGAEAVSGEQYHFPYNFEARIESGKIKVDLDTITLDNNKTLKRYTKELELPTGGKLPDDVTIGTTADDKLQVKDNGLTLVKFDSSVIDTAALHTTDDTHIATSKLISEQLATKQKKVVHSATAPTTSEEVDLWASPSKYGYKYTITGEMVDDPMWARATATGDTEVRTDGLYSKSTGALLGSWATLKDSDLMALLTVSEIELASFSESTFGRAATNVYNHITNFAQVEVQDSLKIKVGSDWVDCGSSLEPDNYTLNLDSNGKIRIADQGVSFEKIATGSISTTIPYIRPVTDNKITTECAVYDAVNARQREVIVSATQPTTPENKDLWVKSSTAGVKHNGTLVTDTAFYRPSGNYVIHQGSSTRDTSTSFYVAGMGTSISSDGYKNSKGVLIPFADLTDSLIETDVKAGFLNLLQPKDWDRLMSEEAFGKVKQNEYQYKDKWTIHIDQFGLDSEGIFDGTETIAWTDLNASHVAGWVIAGDVDEVTTFEQMKFCRYTEEGSDQHYDFYEKFTQTEASPYELYIYDNAQFNQLGGGSGDSGYEPDYETIGLNDNSELSLLSESVAFSNIKSEVIADEISETTYSQEKIPNEQAVAEALQKKQKKLTISSSEPFVADDCDLWVKSPSAMITKHNGDVVTSMQGYLISGDYVVPAGGGERSISVEFYMPNNGTAIVDQTYYKDSKGTTTPINELTDSIIANEFKGGFLTKCTNVDYATVSKSEAFGKVAKDNYAYKSNWTFHINQITCTEDYLIYDEAVTAWADVTVTQVNGYLANGDVDEISDMSKMIFAKYSTATETDKFDFISAFTKEPDGDFTLYVKSGSAFRDLTGRSTNPYVVFNNLSVSGSLTTLDTPCSWDSNGEYKQYIDVTVTGLTANSMQIDMVYPTSVNNIIAPICSTDTNKLRLYFTNATTTVDFVIIKGIFGGLS